MDSRDRMVVLMDHKMITMLMLISLIQLYEFVDRES
jgi:hypothetical protein